MRRAYGPSLWQSLGRIGQRRHASQQSPALVAEHLRAILRETAQPVAVVTTLMSEGGRFHGATLSSFTSIAMHPVPLISFALRIPSRMATALNAARISQPGSTHMVINLLCAAQVAEAERFARPDLYPDPFAKTDYVLTEDGLPVLSGSLGALSCRMVGASWHLHDLDGLEVVSKGNAMASELFIASVTRVEKVPGVEGDGLRTLPLLYRRRAYVTSTSIDEA